MKNPNTLDVWLESTLAGQQSKVCPRTYGGFLIRTHHLRAARAIGLTVPDVDIVFFGDQPSFVTKRYDRIIKDNGHVIRVHLEDTCQALSVLPANKYESDGGPSISAVSSVVSCVAWCTGCAHVAPVLPRHAPPFELFRNTGELKSPGRFLSWRPLPQATASALTASAAPANQAPLTLA